MQISELAARSGVPIGTIKFYIRRGLLSAGRQVNATRAEYDDLHLSRLRLIRSLVEVGEMKLDDVARVIEAMDDDLGLRAKVGLAHYELSRGATETDGDAPTEEAQAQADAVIAALGWEIECGSLHRLALAATIDRLSSYEWSPDPALLEAYGRALHEVTGRELRTIDLSSVEAATTTTVAGTKLYEPFILLLRRLAQEDASTAWRNET